eukprot:5586024-Amphidinium_carterae.1
MLRALKGRGVVDCWLTGRIGGRWKRRGFGMLGRPWIGSFSNTLNSECNGRLMTRHAGVQHDASVQGGWKRPEPADHTKGDMHGGSD